MCVAMLPCILWNLSSLPGMEPTPLYSGSTSLNHWTNHQGSPRNSSLRSEEVVFQAWSGTPEDPIDAFRVVCEVKIIFIAILYGKNCFHNNTKMLIFSNKCALQ